MSKIMIKSLFNRWYQATKKEALDWAKFKLNHIRTCKNDEERLVIVNKNLTGIQFKLNELQ